MSLSRKKHAFTCISKRWDKPQEHSFRRKVKQACHDIEIDFDPDQDWEQANIDPKTLADWGTKLGFSVPPDPEDPHRKWYEQALRK